MNLVEMLCLVTQTVEVLAYNKQQQKSTWEPMIFAEVGPFYPDGRICMKFVPLRYSEAFSGDVYLWTEKELLKRVRKIEVKA